MAKTIECPKCDRKFKDEHGLKQHLADFHKIGKRPRSPERYPFISDDLDGEYEPRQFSVGTFEDDY